MSQPPDGDNVSWRGTHPSVGVDPVYHAFSRLSDAARAAMEAHAPGLGAHLKAMSASAQSAASRAAGAAGRAAASALDGSAKFVPPDGAPVRGSFACWLLDTVAPTCHSLAGGTRARSLRGTMHITDTAAYFVEGGGGASRVLGGAPVPPPSDPITLPLAAVVGVAPRPDGPGVRVDLGAGRWVEFAGFGGEEAVSDAAALLKRK